MTNRSPDTRIIACSIFRSEIQYLIDKHLLEASVEYIDSMYHMNPAKLEEQLERVLQTATNTDHVRNVMVYGECHARMNQLQASGVGRTNAMNCIELVLGREQYRKLRKEGVFFLLPEWTHRWKQVFSQELGLNQKTAKDFFGDMHSRLIYLDTGVKPIPHHLLDEISDFTGLPVEVMKVSLEQLLESIQQALKGALV